MKQFFWGKFAIMLVLLFIISLLPACSDMYVSYTALSNQAEQEQLARESEALDEAIKREATKKERLEELLDKETNGVDIVEQAQKQDYTQDERVFIDIK